MMLANATASGDMPLGTVVSFLCWTLAYVLIIRRSFKDKACGLPMLLLCGNVCWESWYAFVAPQSPEAQVGNVVWWILDVTIFTACLKYGRSDYSHPLTRRFFYPLVALCFVLGGAIQWSLIIGLEDALGMITGIANAFFGAAMMIAMILRRQSMKGQSLYIALSILVGNACGYYGIAFGTTTLSSPSLVWFLYVCLWGSVLLGVVYVGLVLRQCKVDGLNPLKRI